MDWIHKEAQRLAAEVLANTRTSDEAAAARRDLELALRRVLSTSLVVAGAHHTGERASPHPTLFRRVLDELESLYPHKKEV